MTAVLRSFASSLRDTAPMSATLLDHLADELDDSGPVAELLSGHAAVRDPMFGVQVLASLQLLVQSGKARLDGPAHVAWQAAKAAILRNGPEILAGLDRTVQQHQPERAGMLLRGLAELGESRVRLLEIGACAGLNLIVDSYHWSGPGWTWGDEDSPVRLTAGGPAPPGSLEIVERAGCDLQPRDAADLHDVMILRSFIPPEHETQRSNLDAALALAARRGVRVDRASAVDWLREAISAPVDRSVHTVVWHSLVWPYLSRSEVESIESLLRAAPMKLTRVAFEPADWQSPLRLTVTTYPSGSD